MSKKSVSLFTEMGVLNEAEIHARQEIMLEQYQMAIQIEARVIGDLAGNHIIPTAIRYQNMLIENVKGLKEVLPQASFKKASVQPISIIEEISERVSIIKESVDGMISERKKANVLTDSRDKAIAYDEKVKPYFETIRYHVDKLEMLVDDELWPLPKYRELLFTR